MKLAEYVIKGIDSEAESAFNGNMRVSFYDFFNMCNAHVLCTLYVGNYKRVEYQSVVCSQVSYSDVVQKMYNTSKNYEKSRCPTIREYIFYADVKLNSIWE